MYRSEHNGPTFSSPRRLSGRSFSFLNYYNTRPAISSAGRVFFFAISNGISNGLTNGLTATDQNLNNLTWFLSCCTHSIERWKIDYYRATNVVKLNHFKSTSTDRKPASFNRFRFSSTVSGTSTFSSASRLRAISNSLYPCRRL